ncbi:hypothetical protein BDW71DRAFT_201412 [Aspergillus fruticulosus]
MAPSITENPIVVPEVRRIGDVENFDVAPVIGRGFPSASLAEWLRAPNSDELLRDLAITISQRGVVFFRKQDGLTDDLQKELVDRLGRLTGKPNTSGLHIHPVSNSAREESTSNDEISVISSVQRQKLYKGNTSSGRSGRHEYNALLRLTELPKSGGDTLWASGYEVDDRISKPYQTFLDSLTATYAQPRFNQIAHQIKFSVHPGPRGAPENVGEDPRAIHPVVRTNPVTGWKSIFAVGHHVEKVNDVGEDEGRHLLDWFVRLVTENHDLQVRFRWQNPNDVAIWDDRSVYHAATFDYQHLGPRTGHRAVGLGERPYFDQKSKSRREALGLN